MTSTIYIYFSTHSTFHPGHWVWIKVVWKKLINILAYSVPTAISVVCVWFIHMHVVWEVAHLCVQLALYRYLIIMNLFMTRWRLVSLLFLLVMLFSHWGKVCKHHHLCIRSNYVCMSVYEFYQNLKNGKLFVIVLSSYVFMHKLKNIVDPGRLGVQITVLQSVLVATSWSYYSSCC